jgi:hypothetical protein
MTAKINHRRSPINLPLTFEIRRKTLVNKTLWPEHRSYDSPIERRKKIQKVNPASEANENPCKPIEAQGIQSRHALPRSAACDDHRKLIRPCRILRKAL